MSRLVESWQALRLWHRSQLVLRAILLLGPVVALLAAGIAGAVPSPWVLGVALLLSVLWSAAPESAAGTGAFLLVLAWWASVPDDALHPAALLAAVVVLAAHVAALLSATAPPRTPLDPAVLRLWVLRGSAVLGAAPVLWVLARVLRDEAAPGGLWPAALVCVLVAVVALGAGLARSGEDLP